jgi:hypothetical protein
MRNILATLLISLFSLTAFAAGSPMHEDFTELLGISDKMLEAAKQADGPGFTQLAEQGLSVAKDQNMKGTSPGLQRVMERMKHAKKAGKKGDFEKGTKLIEEAIAEMKKEKAPLQIGGGT